MSDGKDARIAELEQALLPFVRVAIACAGTYDQRGDRVVWRAPIMTRSKAVVTYGQISRAKELLGLDLDS